MGVMIHRGRAFEGLIRVYSLSDRLLFAVPKSKYCPLSITLPFPTPAPSSKSARLLPESPPRPNYTPLHLSTGTNPPPEGRLHQSCLDLLQGSDIQFHRHSRLDIALCINFPIALIFLPAADIPVFVGEGRVGLGITGHDQVRESRTTEVEQILDLGFGKCKLQVQVPEKGNIQDPKDLVGRNVVTSFVSLTREYFEKLEVEMGGEERRGATKIKYVGGSVEAACALGVADGIVDLVGI